MKVSNEINSKRIKIDEIDKLIIKLLSDRLEVSKEIANLKIYMDIENYDQSREKIIFENIERTISDNQELDKLEHIFEIYKTLLKESKLYQSKKCIK